MGVLHLWSMLAPVKEHQALCDLQGMTLAVDLSMWVCETQCVKQMQGVVTKPYLRNLFFRVSHLTHLGIKLVFVIEGAAPQLKFETMTKRQQVRYQEKGQKCTSQSVKPKKQSRSHFKASLKECCELLDYMGVPYVQSEGEAEAMCAFLDRTGVVDGCLTDDGDAFLYGARTVFRNFTMNTKDPHVECYRMSDIHDQLGLDRERLVACALLLGCDYLPKGVPGVGKENVLKLMKSFQGDSILQRFKDWTTNASLAEMPPVEVNVRKKAALLPAFPQKQVIDEFMITRDKHAAELKFRRPKLAEIKAFGLLKLEWPEEYTEEKVVPLVTLWDMRELVNTGPGVPARNLAPHRIVKARIRHGVQSLEIEWYREKDAFCTSSGEEKALQYHVTVEERDLFEKCFPEMVGKFLELKGNKVKVAKPKKASKKIIEESNICQLLSAVDINAKDEHSSDKLTTSPVNELTNAVLSGLGRLTLEQSQSSNQQEKTVVGVSHSDDFIPLADRIKMKSSANYETVEKIDKAQWTINQQKGGCSAAIKNTNKKHTASETSVGFKVSNIGSVPSKALVKAGNCEKQSYHSFAGNESSLELLEVSGSDNVFSDSMSNNKESDDNITFGVDNKQTETAYTERKSSESLLEDDNCHVVAEEQPQLVCPPSSRPVRLIQNDFFIESSILNDSSFLSESDSILRVSTPQIKQRNVLYSEILKGELPGELADVPPTYHDDTATCSKTKTIVKFPDIMLLQSRVQSGVQSSTPLPLAERLKLKLGQRTLFRDN